MNLIAADLRIIKRQTATDVTQLFFTFQLRGQRQQTQPITVPSRAFQPMRIADTFTEHLQPAANAQ